METSSHSRPQSPRSFDARKFVLAFVVLIISLGALGWQVLDYRRRQPRTIAGDLTPPIQWRQATVVETKAVTSSITAQLEAFKRDDYKTATKYQSARLRQNFGSVEKFRAMIRNGYPHFAHYKKVRFGPVQADEKGRLALVAVNIVGVDGKLAAADYQMVLEQGLWRVAGVAGGNAIVPRRAPLRKGQTTA